MQLSSLPVLRLYHAVKTYRQDMRTVSVASIIDGNKTYLFNLKQLREKRGLLMNMLSQLSDSAMQSENQEGIAWFMARYNHAGQLWTHDLLDVDLLLAMGRALGYVSICQPDKESYCLDPLILVSNLEAVRRERELPYTECNKSIATGLYFHRLRHQPTKSIL